MKKITIGLVTFNRPDLLKRAVKSILNQSYKNFILYVGNDYVKKNVTFKSLGIKKTNKIKIFNHKKNLGERDNLNFLLNLSKTEWFCWLGDDDYLHKDFFKILHEGSTRFKKKNLVACYSNYSRAKLKNDKKIINYHLFDKNDFLLGFTSKKIRLIGVYGLIKTKILKRIKGIHKTGLSFKQNKNETNHYPYCDPLVAIMLSNFGKIMWIDERLIHLNTDDISISAKTTDYDIYKSAEKYVLKKLKNIIKTSKNQLIKDEIVTNMINRFFNTRAEIIARRELAVNIINSPKIFLDNLILFNELPKKNIFIMFKKQIIIFKIIYNLIKKKYFE